MVRKIGGPIAGVVIAMVGIAFLRWLINYVFGPPGIDPGDTAAYVEAMEAGTFVGVAMATFAGTLFGAFVGARIAKDVMAAWAVAGVVLIWTLWRVISVPHPMWFVLASVVLIALAGWFAGVMARAGGFEDEEDEDDRASASAPAYTAPAYEAPPEPEPARWPEQGYDDPEPDIFEPEPEPQPERPRWTPLPPRSED